MQQINREIITNWFKSLQDNICSQLEAADGAGKFRQDEWQRPGGGGGRSRVLEGQHIEKGGVNFSAVYGEISERVQKSLQLVGNEFFATGVSIVLHPYNPQVPIIHMNVRYFEMSNGTNWFGGGIDLTPHYVIEGDARWFHQQLKNTCDRYHPEYYPRFKKWADDYFYIPHRQETRGVGGIFFDYLKPSQQTTEELFEFVKAVGETFVPTYTHLMSKNKSLPFGEEQKHWQYLRRGRYAEFNLVWDRGTKFGLETGGRTESILMSLPPQAQWEYNHSPQPDTPEAHTLSLLKKGITWV